MTGTAPPPTGPAAAAARLDEDALLRAIESAPTVQVRPNAIQASLAYGWRTMLKIKHVPEQLFDVTMFPIMFTLLFTYLFGGALAGSPREYLQFLIPGILVQTVAFVTLYTGFSLNTDIKRGVFDRFRTMPVWNPAPLAGALLGDVARYSLASLIVVIVGLTLGFRPAGGAPGVLAGVGLVVVFAFSLSWIWTLLGMVLRTPESVLYGSMMVLFPLTFASNVFVDPATMPGWLEAAVNQNPITHLTTATRDLMHGSFDAAATTRTLAWSAVIAGIFAPLAMRRYRRMG